MAVTNYYSVNGVITGEEVLGGSRTDYLTDALGSVVATVNQNAQVVNTYRYKPYGSVLAKTGAGSDPSFQWVGAQGYRQTGKSYAEVYIRARHYSPALGRWTTQDPMSGPNTMNRYADVDHSAIEDVLRFLRHVHLIEQWSSERSYLYAIGNPIRYIDPSGKRPVYPGDPRWPKPPDYRPPTRCIYEPPEVPLTLMEALCVRRAYNSAVDAQKRLDPKEFPPGNGGPRDAFRHCLGACLARRMCGENAYQRGIIDHERNGAWWAEGHWDPVYSPMDLANDAEGHKCATQIKGSKRTCESCCLKKLRDGDLYILPPKYRDKK